MARKTRGAGRPPIPARDRHDVRVVVLFTNQDGRRIRDAVERAGKPLSEWARDLMLKAAEAA